MALTVAFALLVAGCVSFGHEDGTTGADGEVAGGRGAPVASQADVAADENRIGDNRTTTHAQNVDNGGQSPLTILQIGPEFVRFTGHEGVEYRITSTAGDATFRGTISGNVTVAPLRPNSEYEIHVTCPSPESEPCNISQKFTTIPNPYSWHAGPISPIQPGGGIGWVSPINVGVVLVEPTNESVYVITSGHYFTGQGRREVGENETGGPAVGEIVQTENGDGFDYALIKVKPEFRGLVSPKVRHYSGPTGVADPNHVMHDAKLCIVGQGWNVRGVAEDGNLSRRCGYIDSTKPTEVRVQLNPIISGDSGSPIILAETGQIIGIADSISVGTVDAQTLCTILDRLTYFGYNLTLARAPFVEPDWPVAPPKYEVPIVGRNQENQCPEWVIKLNN